jgi:prepilin-type N-terminal cleavage/methylation domain-containing protein
MLGEFWQLSRRTVSGGFTLIELSIVLVIIGLIVGGVLVGQGLIRAAELRSVITDQERYITAVATFKGKYNEVPGDMVDATTYWGTDPGGCPNYASPYASAQTATCNGNGNGFIENDGTGNDFTQSYIYENFRAWQQLADANLMSGSYTGTLGPASYADNEPGLNVPTTKLASGGGFEWTVFTANARYSATIWNAQLNTQYLLLGAASSYDLVNPLLSPADARAIDLKVDDGMPASGNVLAMLNTGGATTCTTPNWSPPITYSTNLNTLQCTLLFTVKAW